MDEQVFMEQMTRLADCFGAKYYNRDRLALIWREVNQLSNEWMRRTVDTFVGNCRMAPLMPEFKEEISRERERLWQIKKREKPNLEIVSQYLCPDCTNTGVVMLGEGVGTVYRCHCKNGDNRIEKWPKMARNPLKAVN